MQRMNHKEIVAHIINIFNSNNYGIGAQPKMAHKLINKWETGDLCLPESRQTTADKLNSETWN